MPSETLLLAVIATAELCGSPFSSDAVAEVFLDDLASYPEAQVLAALKRCRLEHKGRLTVADVLSRIEDGRPGVEAAWAQIATLQDERKSLVWCDEMRAAWAAALPLLDSGDAVAARMAFKEEYTRRLAQARLERIPPRWTVTPGNDPDHRAQVVTDAAQQGLLSTEYAATLLPYHQPPTPAGQRLLEAVTAPAAPAPDEASAGDGPALTVQERIAPLKAAVTGAALPAPAPPPPAPPGLSPDAQDRLLAEACARYQPVDDTPVWTPPVEQETLA